MPHFSPHYEKTLLQKIAEGDEQSFRVIYDHYRPNIYKYALRLTESEIAAEEILQEIFIKVWLKRSSLAELDLFSYWLFRVSRNTIFDSFRKLERQKAGTAKLAVITPASVNDADTWLLDKENDVWLRDALDRLTPSQKQVYLLSRQQGMKPEEIAEELKISVGTAKKHLVNSLQGLRAYIEKHNAIMLIIAAGTAVHCN